MKEGIDNLYLSWRSIGALVYFSICIVDLVGMPLYREWGYNKIEASELVEVARQFPDPVSQIEAMQILKADRSWEPVTGEMFHLSFGAILGLSALPSNRRGSGFIRRPRRKDEEDEEDDYEGKLE